MCVCLSEHECRKKERGDDRRGEIKARCDKLLLFRFWIFLSYILHLSLTQHSTIVIGLSNSGVLGSRRPIGQEGAWRDGWLWAA